MQTDLKDERSQFDGSKNESTMQLNVEFSP